MPEKLVVLFAQDASRGMAEIQKSYRVLSLLPPRLAVVELDDNGTQAVRRMPATQAVIAGPTDAMPPNLQENERLFIDAWQQRLSYQNKRRVGEGKSWDAEGFQPPDPPKRP